MGETAMQERIRAAFEKLSGAFAERGIETADPTEEDPEREQLIARVGLKRQKVGGLLSRRVEIGDALIILARDSPDAEPTAVIYFRLCKDEPPATSTVEEFTAQGQIVGAWPDAIAESTGYPPSSDEIATQALEKAVGA
jgi:hypothetical protein